MARESRLGTSYVMGHGLFMLCLGMALCSLGSFMTNPRVEASGYTAAVVLTGASLIGMLLLVCRGMIANGVSYRRGFGIYMWIGLFSIACWVVFWLNRLAPLDMLILLAGLQGLFSSLWYVAVAFQLRAYPRQSSILCVLAGITSAIGIFLSTQPNLSDISAVTAVACYLTWIGIQTLLTAPYLFRGLEQRTPDESWVGTENGRRMVSRY
jgi:hypothetical protein